MSKRRSNIKVRAAFAVYTLLIVGSFGSLWATDDLSFGRHPIENFIKTVEEMGRPSFLDAWFGQTNRQYISDDGTVLRTENPQELERNFIAAVARALWVTFAISTLGTLLAALAALPLGWAAASNIKKPKLIALSAKIILDCSRSIHTLVFGLIFVGIVGLGPTAGILAIGAHAMGTFGKLYAETIETIDMGPINAIRGVGASPMQIFSFGIIPAVLPSFVSTYLYIWEFNTRDSTVLGLIGAGGLGLLLSEAISLFQWDRLSTLLLTLILFVLIFDALSRRLRTGLV